MNQAKANPLADLLEGSGLPSSTRPLGTAIGPDLRASRPQDGASKAEVSRYLRSRSVSVEVLSGLLQTTLAALTSEDVKTVQSALAGVVLAADSIQKQGFLSFGSPDGLPAVSFDSGKVPAVKQTKKVETLAIEDGKPVKLTSEVALTPTEIEERQSKAIDRARKLAAEVQRGLDCTAIDTLGRVSIALQAVNRAKMASILAENPRQSPKGNPEYVQAKAATKALGKLSEGCQGAEVPPVS